MAIQILPQDRPYDYTDLDRFSLALQGLGETIQKERIRKDEQAFQEVISNISPYAEDGTKKTHQQILSEIETGIKNVRGQAPQTKPGIQNILHNMFMPRMSRPGTTPTEQFIKGQRLQYLMDPTSPELKELDRKMAQLNLQRAERTMPTEEDIELERKGKRMDIKQRKRTMPSKEDIELSRRLKRSQVGEAEVTAPTTEDVNIQRRLRRSQAETSEMKVPTAEDIKLDRDLKRSMIAENVRQSGDTRTDIDAGVRDLMEVEENVINSVAGEPVKRTGEDFIDERNRSLSSIAKSIHQYIQESPLQKRGREDALKKYLNRSLGSTGEREVVEAYIRLLEKGKNIDVVEESMKEPVEDFIDKYKEIRDAVGKPGILPAWRTSTEIKNMKPKDKESIRELLRNKIKNYNTLEERDLFGGKILSHKGLKDVERQLLRAIFGEDEFALESDNTTSPQEQAKNQDRELTKSIANLNLSIDNKRKTQNTLKELKRIADEKYPNDNTKATEEFIKAAEKMITDIENSEDPNSVALQYFNSF